MRDRNGEIMDKAHAIIGLDKLRLAIFLNDIKRNPDKYPNSNMEWLEWLNQDSGDNIDNL